MELTTVWFIVIAFLWTGYFVLEGFDFGVGMWMRLLARDEKERRVMINTIGPVWDGNEVWFIVAGGATFAAFPDWYATMFSGFYLPLLVILLSLIVRGVSLEYRGKRSDPVWRRRADLGLGLGSLLAAFAWGVVFGSIVGGVPIAADKEYVGGLASVLTPYALVTGVVTTSVFLTHGAVFLALKTADDLAARARRRAVQVGAAAGVLAVCWLGWTVWQHRGETTVWLLAALAVAAFAGGWAMLLRRRDSWAFAGTAAAIVAVMATMFVGLFPDLMPSTLNPAWSLTTTNAAATPYTLTIMTVVALACTPFVLAYQAWTYWVFRRRLSVHEIPDEEPSVPQPALPR